jgi:hypothetical protein
MTTRITLTALPALYDRRRSMFSIMAAPDQTPITVTVQVRSTPDIAASIERFGAAIRARSPGASFLVLLEIPKGEKTPPGFRAARRAGTFRLTAFLHAGTRRPPFRRLLRR